MKNKDALNLANEINQSIARIEQDSLESGEFAFAYKAGAFKKQLEFMAIKLEVLAGKK